MNVPKQNLGLLVVLDALLTEGSVTGASRRLHLSQPAVSSALRRLRAWLKDPLLVKVKGGYTLTARAIELTGPVRRILEEIDHTVSAPAAFEPRTAARRFRIATNDAFQLVVLPKLMSRLQQQAPRITLAVVPSGPAVDIAALEKADVDLCVGHFAAIPAGLHSRVLMQERLIGAVRRGHPIIKRAPSLKQYAELPHVLIAPQGDPFLGFALRALEEAELTFEAQLQLPHVLAASLVIAQTDLVTTLPERVARVYAGLLDLQLFKPPIAFPPFNISAVWHERAHRDPAHVWLRAFLLDVCRGL